MTATLDVRCNDGTWQVQLPSGWQSCESESDARLIATAPALWDDLHHRERYGSLYVDELEAMAAAYHRNGLDGHEFTREVGQAKEREQRHNDKWD